jgi:hypothetical protein
VKEEVSGETEKEGKNEEKKKNKNKNWEIIFKWK